MRDITKSFPGVKALDGVNLKVEKGTVHALMGENGAGKSTLMKILFGQQPPDSGTILFNGQEVHFKSVKEAVNAGISMIYQELSPIKELSLRKTYSSAAIRKPERVRSTGKPCTILARRSLTAGDSITILASRSRCSKLQIFR